MMKSSTRICFVCSGNICRSPYAEALLRHLATAEGWGERIVVTSRGVLDLGDAPAHEHAITVGSERGPNLLRHRAAQINEAHVEDCEIILGMTREHAEVLRELFPAHAHRIYLLGSFPGDGLLGESIPDPMGEAIDTFRSVFELIERALEPLQSDLRRRFGAKE